MTIKRATHSIAAAKTITRLRETDLLIIPSTAGDPRRKSGAHERLCIGSFRAGVARDTRSQRAIAAGWPEQDARLRVENSGCVSHILSQPCVPIFSCWKWKEGLRTASRNNEQQTSLKNGSRTRGSPYIEWDKGLLHSLCGFTEWPTLPDFKLKVYVYYVQSRGTITIDDFDLDV